MDRDALALRLIGSIYDAVVKPARWQKFVAEFARTLDDSAVALGFDFPGASRTFAAGIDPDGGRECLDDFGRDASRTAAARRRFTRGFALAPARADRRSTAASAQASWRKARGLADARPIGHLIAIDGGQPIASIVAHRRRGSRPFREKHIAQANRLVPHLSRAFDMVRAQSHTDRQRLALAEVMDRLAAGVILLNEEGRIVLTNRSATRILQRDDGILLEDGRLRVADASADRTLQRLISEVTAPRPKSVRAVGGTLIAPRPSKNDSYPISISRLLPGSTVRDAVASVIVSDPRSGTDLAVELLRSVHGLTPAEADLVHHLARGRSLEEAAGARGISIHTARSQLKQVFHKTRTHRQGDLVRLVLRCFLPMGEDTGEDATEDGGRE